MDWTQFLLAALAGLAAGLVNALAGGGTLITFPVLTAIGLPAVAANVTSTVALCPGYFGASLAQWRDLAGRRHWLWLYVPAGLVGGWAGAFLLLQTGERTFRTLVPYLILLAALLLAVGDPLRAWLKRRSDQTRQPSQSLRPALWTVLPVALAAVYGGYFGAGMSVIILAILGLLVSASLTTLNAIKQVIAFSANVAAVSLFIFSDQVHWPVAAVMAVCALAGGHLGGTLAGRIRPDVLRWVVVAAGVVVAIFYFIRG